MKTPEQTIREQEALSIISTITEAQPCKPRRSMSHTDKLPQVYRSGALDAESLPSLEHGKRIYRDGRIETP